METRESKIIETLKDQAGKWIGLHIILLRFEEDEWAGAWQAVETLVRQGIIEKTGHIHHHEITQTPSGMLYLYRYLHRQKPQLGVVE